MERKLSQAFDRQRFQQNERLAGIISDVESRYAHVLSDDDFELISAAGEATVRTMPPEALLDRHNIPEDFEKNRG